jgi:hypothetical protein
LKRIISYERDETTGKLLSDGLLVIYKKNSTEGKLQNSTEGKVQDIYVDGAVAEGKPEGSQILCHLGQVSPAM